MDKIQNLFETFGINESSVADEKIEELLEKIGRRNCFEETDAVRTELANMGTKLKDTSNKTREWIQN